MLRALGADVTLRRRRAARATGAGAERLRPLRAGAHMRASIIVMGPMVARLGRGHHRHARAAATSGRGASTFTSAACEKLGAAIEIEHGFIRRAPRRAARRRGAARLPQRGRHREPAHGGHRGRRRDGHRERRPRARDRRPVPSSSCRWAPHIEGAGTQHDRDRGRARRCTACTTRSSPTASRPAPT